MLAPYELASLGVQALFHAGWFSENLLTQACALLLLRTRRSFDRLGQARGALIAALAGLALLIPLGPPAASLGLASPPLGLYLLLAAIVAGFCALLTAAKVVYTRTGHTVP